MKPTAKQSPLSSVPLMVAAVACALALGCSETRHYHAPKPVSAELQIYTVDPKTGERKWMTNQRTVYTYREDDE